MTTPVITKMEVYPVAGKDCMELNLSGAHAPYFTRNVVVLYADNGEMGVGEVPGGKKITNALEEKDREEFTRLKVIKRSTTK